MTKTLIINVGIGEVRASLLENEQPTQITLMRDHEPSILGLQFEARVVKIAVELDGAFVKLNEQPVEVFLPRRGIIKTSEQKNKPINNLVNEGQAISVEITRDAIAADNKLAIAKEIASVSDKEASHFIHQLLAKKGYGGIDEIIVDDLTLLAQLKKQLPEGDITLTTHADKQPLFAYYGVEEKLAEVVENKIPLPSGGWISIEATHALTAIDVNSSSAGDRLAPDNALRANLEAATAIAKALVLQNIGGLVVVDFIDMLGAKAKTNLQEVMEQELKADPLHVEVGKLSPFGLFEIKRQKSGENLRDKLVKQNESPRPDATALELLRQAQKLGEMPSVGDIEIKAHAGVINWLENNAKACDMLKESTARNLKLKSDNSNIGEVRIINPQEKT